MVKLSDCEERILKIIWECKEEPNSKTIMKVVNEKHELEWKIQTVSTFLARLVRKGYLTMHRKGRIFYYTPTITLNDYRRVRIQEMIAFLYDGDLEKLKEDLM